MIHKYIAPEGIGVGDPLYHGIATRLYRQVYTVNVEKAKAAGLSNFQIEKLQVNAANASATVWAEVECDCCTPEAMEDFLQTQLDVEDMTQTTLKRLGLIN